MKLPTSRAGGLREPKKEIEMTRSGQFNLILWGFVITILDIRSDPIDFLPDSLGYVLLAIGAGGLSASERQFGVARVLSWLLVPIAVIDDALGGLPWLAAVRIPLDCALIWFLLGGIIMLARSAGCHDLAGLAVRIRLASIILAAAAAVLGLTGGGEWFGLSLSMILVIVMLALAAMTVHLLWRAKTELGE